LVKDGADGFQLDKTNVVGFLDFNPELPTSPTKRSPSTPDDARRRRAELRAVNPEFALASEIIWDRSFR